MLGALEVVRAAYCAL